jgi:predicted ester cyclase
MGSSTDAAAAGRRDARSGSPFAARIGHHGERSGAMSGSDQKKAAVRGFFESAERLDLDALDAIVSPDYVLHDPSLPEEVRGLEGAKGLVEMYGNAIGGLRVTIEHQFAEGDFVATRFTARGTHEGEIMGVAPTGRELTLTGIAISRFRDGKIVEEWEVSDVMGLLRQIGGLPALAER